MEVTNKWSIFENFSSLRFNNEELFPTFSSYCFSAFQSFFSIATLKACTNKKVIMQAKFMYLTQK